MTTPNTPTPQPAQAERYSVEPHEDRFIVRDSQTGFGACASLGEEDAKRICYALNRLPVVEAGAKALGIELQDARIEIGGLTADRNILTAQRDTLARRVEELEKLLTLAQSSRDKYAAAVGTLNVEVAECDKSNATLRTRNEALAGALIVAADCIRLLRNEDNFMEPSFDPVKVSVEPLAAIKAALAAHRNGGAEATTKAEVKP